ncbi:hypothetical protein ACFWDP_39815, partial [Streptomyces anthocyanicus]
MTAVSPAVTQVKQVTHEEWLRRAKALEPVGTHLIDGTDEPGGGSTFAALSPRDGQVLAEVADG